MNNFCLWCKFVQITGNTVVKSGSDGKSTSHSLTALLLAYFPCIPTVSNIKVHDCANRAFSHDSCYHGNCSFFNKFIKKYHLLLRYSRRRQRGSAGFAVLQHLICFFSCPICTLSFGLYPRICTLSGYSAGPAAVWISFGISIKNRSRFSGHAM